MPAQYRCGQLGRRLAVRDASPPTLNGIDYLEVGDDPVPVGEAVRKR